MWLTHLWAWLTHTSRSLWSRLSRKTLITLESNTTSEELTQTAQLRMKSFRQEVRQRWDRKKLNSLYFKACLK